MYQNWNLFCLGATFWPAVGIDELLDKRGSLALARRSGGEGERERSKSKSKPFDMGGDGMAEEEYTREVIGRRDGPAIALSDAARASAAVWAIETGTVSCKNGCRGRWAYSGKRARMAQAVSLYYQYLEPAAIHA
jgi:hypothetical protein